MIDRFPKRAAVAAAALAVVLGCGASSDGDSAGGDPAGHSATDEAAFEPGEVRIATLADVEAEIASRKGSGFLLNFWAIWCAPCVAELPELHECKEAFADAGGDVLLISYDLMIPIEGPPEAEIDKVREFLSKREFSFDSLVYDEDGYDGINDLLDLPGGVPVTLAFDANGEIVDRQVNQAGRERFDEMMRKALGQD